MAISFPARAIFVAAMNPCPCGHYQEVPREGSARVCLCGFEAVRRYRGRVSGPLLDRIDLHVSVDVVPYRALAHRASGETSADVRARVIAARQRQYERFGGQKVNGVMKHSDLQRFVKLDAASMLHVEKAMEHDGLSTRAITRALKVARTIADLEGSDHVQEVHVSEAIGLRVLDRDAQPIALVLSA